MAPNNSGLGRILLLAVCVALVIFINRRVHGPGPQSSSRIEHPPLHEGKPPSEERRPEQFLRHERRPGYREQIPAFCQAFGTSCDSRYFGSWNEPVDGACTVRSSHGYPIPDPQCTPGGINPTVTVTLLRNPDWKTRCIRNCQRSEAEKHIAYDWYGIQKPRPNSGNRQVCELDHLVPLELGGADGLGNIWPECGPDEATLQNRYFKVKDRVENYLADEVKSGRISLGSAQRGIASDWTQYLPAANRYCQAGGCC
jgi:hypothetical protein